MRIAALFARPLVAHTADMVATASGGGAAVSGVSLLPAAIDGPRPVREIERVVLEQGSTAEGGDKAEVFVLAPKDGQALEGELGLIRNYGKSDGLDLSRLGQFTVLDTVKLDDVHAGRSDGHAPEAGRKLSLDLDADGREDAFLLVTGDGFLPIAAKDLPSGVVGSPINPDPGVRPLPVEPPGGWKTNMPMLPGGPVTLPAPIAGTVAPITARGSAGDGEVHILPYPMPDTAPGEATILPFPLPGSPVSFASWGAWIGL